MERYRGLIDREVVIADNPTGALAHLATLPAVEFYAEFFDYDTDCQTGTVTGTLGAPQPPRLRRPPAALRARQLRPRKPPGA